MEAIADLTSDAAIEHLSPVHGDTLSVLQAEIEFHGGRGG